MTPRRSIYVASSVAVLAVVLRNLDIPGVWLIAVGAGCNLAAIVANGGWMPADPRALASVGGAPAGPSNSIVVPDPALAPLTDLFALPAWLPFANVFSIGDVLMAIGIAATIAVAMRRAPISRARPVTLPELGSSLPEVFVRTAIVYLFLVVVLRISGKREVGQMSILELIVVLVISDAVQNSMVGENTTIWGGLVAVLTLLGLDAAIKSLAHRSRRVRHAIEGEPRLLVRDGRLLTKALGEEHVEAEEVRAAVRAHGLARRGGRPAGRARGRRLDQRDPEGRRGRAAWARRARRRRRVRRADRRR